jgi:hypothetical protein
VTAAPFQAMTLHLVPRLAVGAVLAASLLASPRSARADDTSLSACIAANESSIQLRSSHKLLQSREQSLACAADTCPALLRDACKKRLEQIAAAIPSIVFDAKDATGNDVAVAVTIDGRPAEAVQGIAVALDPGEHSFVFTAVGQRPVEKSFILREGEKGRREPVVIGTAPPKPAGDGVAGPPGPLPPPPAPLAGTSSSWSGQRTVALVAGGTGLAGMAVGSVFGLMSRSSWSSSQSECPSSTNCPQHGQAVTDHDAASTQATISTVAFAAGGVALAAGAVLWVTAPRAATEASPTLRLTPSVGPESAGLLLGGVFW